MQNKKVKNFIKCSMDLMKGGKVRQSFLWQANQSSR